MDMKVDNKTKIEGREGEFVAQTMNAVEVEKQINILNGHDLGELEQFHGGAIDAINRMSKMLLALQEGSDLVVDPLDMDWRDKLDGYAMKYSGPLTHYIYGLEMIARLAWTQRGELVADRRAWLNDLLDHMTGEGGVHKDSVASQAYAGPARLETTRIENGMYHLTWLGLNDSNGDVLLGGVGAGERVEGQLVDGMRGSGLISAKARVFGLDGRPPAEHYQGMELRKGDLERLVEQNYDWINKISKIFLIGSVTSNMNLLVEQVRYWLEFGAVAKEGGLMVMNLAAIEPLGDKNERMARSKKFAIDNGVAADGSLPVNVAWARESDKPGETGARIEFLLVLLAMARFAKWEVINFPEPGSEEWKELMRVANDVDKLREATELNKDAMAMPFYLAQETGDLVTVRMDLIARYDSRRSDPGEKGAENILNAILDELWKRQGR